MLTCDEVIRSAIRDLEGHTERDFRTKYRPTRIVVQEDKDRFMEAISNLLSNASRHTVAGTIEISARSGLVKATISLKHSGSGFDPDILPRLFTKFATKSERGTRPGLFICKSIIEPQGRRIWTANNTESRGASCSFTLPITLNL